MTAIKKIEAWECAEGKLFRSEVDALIATACSIISTGADDNSFHISSQFFRDHIYRNLPVLMPILTQLMEPKNWTTDKEGNKVPITPAEKTTIVGHVTV
jgi:hypothetical protein